VANFRRLDVGVRVEAGPLTGGAKTLTATLTARPGCGSIDHIQFGTAGAALNNASVTITSPTGGPSSHVTGFTYTPTAGTSSVALRIQRVVPSGGATVSPILFFDGCGQWRTFVGGGPGAFQ